MSNPNVIVEMNADEKKVLAAYERLKRKEEEYQSTIKKTGQVSKTTQSEIGKAMIAAGEAAASGMAGYLKELKAARGFGPKVASEIELAWIASGKAGVRSMADVLVSIGHIDQGFKTVGQNAIDSLTAADRAAKFTNTRQELNALGGDFSIMSKHIEKEMAGSFEDSVAKANELVAKMKELDPSAAQLIENAIRGAGKEIKEADFGTLQKQLAASGDEGRELANVISGDLKQAALDAEGGLDGVLQKIIQMRPETEASVQKYRAANAEAAKFTEGKYAEVLETLRKGDPIAKQVAATLKRELVAAGEIVERSFDDMIAPLDKIDPKAAEAARRLKSEAEDAANTSEGHFARFSQSAIAKIGAIAGAYVGIQEAIQFANELLKEQEDILRDAATRKLDLAGAQQEAGKNLAAFSDKDRNDLLEAFVPQVSADVGFSDLKQLTLAVGAAGSAGGNTKQVKSAVEAAAKLNRLTPEAVPDFAAAAIDIGRAIGVDDARTSLGLLLSTNTQSRVVDPAKTARNLAPILFAGVQSSPLDDRKEASKDMAALFATGTKVATDITGEMSTNAGIQLNERLTAFFRNLPAEIQETQDKLANLKKGELSNVEEERLSQLQSLKAGFTPEVQAELGVLVGKVESGGKLHRTEQTRLRELKDMEFTRGDAARMRDLEDKKTATQEKFEANRDRLQADLKRAQGVSDPGSFRERMLMVQRNKGMQEAVFSTEFGEQRFRGMFRDLLTDENSEASQLFRESRSKISADPRLFDREAERTGTGTSSLKVARFTEGFKAREGRRLVNDDEGSMLHTQRTEVARVLALSRSGTGLGAMAREGLGQEFKIERGMLPGSTAAEEAVGMIDTMRSRLGELRHNIGGGPVSKSDQEKIDLLEGSIKALRDEMTLRPEMFAEGSLGAAAERAGRKGFQGPTGPDSPRGEFFITLMEDLLAAQTRQNELLDLQLKAANETASNTNPRKNRNLNGAPNRMGPQRGNAAP